MLPFTNLSGAAEQEYFADGLTEDILTGLSRFRELFVIFPEHLVQVQGPGRRREAHRAEDVKLCVEALKAMRNLAGHQADVREQRLLAMARSQDDRPIVAAWCTPRGVGTLSAIRFLREIGDVRPARGASPRWPK